MDWRETGRLVREEWEQKSARVDMTGARNIPDSEWQFLKAVLDAARGDHAPIAYYLRSGQPLPDGFREWLADYFEGYFHDRRGRGHPKDHLVHLAADVAKHYFDQWRKVNDRNGVKDFRIRWAAGHADGLFGADPEMPACLYGRDADNWRPLFAIADLIGGHWPKKAREVAGAASARYSDELASIQILHDIAAIFEERGVDRMSSEELVSALVEMENRPWPEWGRSQRPISRHQLARLLDAHGIVPGSIRLPSGRTPKGYYRRAFTDELARYPLWGSRNATTTQPLQDKGLRLFQSATPDELVAFQKDGKPLQGKACVGVATQNPQSGGVSDDNDPFSSLKDPSLKLDDWPELPPELDRRRRGDLK